VTVLRRRYCGGAGGTAHSSPAAGYLLTVTRASQKKLSTVVYRTLTVDFGESNSTAPMMLLVYLMTQAASSHRSEPGALRWRQSDAHCELLQVGCRLLLTLLTTHGPNPDAHS